MDELLSIINAEYVDTVDVNEITEEMMTDVVSKLDPHSVYIPAADLENVNSELEGSFSGIGVQFRVLQDTIYVVAIVKGGPSERAGLIAGDRIVTINDSAFTGSITSNDKILKTLRGDKLSLVPMPMLENWFFPLQTLSEANNPANEVRYPASA